MRLERSAELVGAKPLHLLTQTALPLKSPTGAFIATLRSANAVAPNAKLKIIFPLKMPRAKRRAFKIVFSYRTAVTPVDIPEDWDPRAKQQQRVAFADFSTAPWQGLEKSERCPNNSSLILPQAAVVVVALG